MRSIAPSPLFLRLLHRLAGPPVRFPLPSSASSTPSAVDPSISSIARVPGRPRFLPATLATLLALIVLPFLSAASVPPPPPLSNDFGLHLRRGASDLRTTHAPTLIGPHAGNESCLVARTDGTLEHYAIARPAGDRALVMRSRDGGLTWSTPELAFPLPGTAYHAIRVLEARDGTLHAVFHILGAGPGYRGRLYEVYTTRRATSSATWTPPEKIVPGYIGSIRGFIQHPATGRLILAVARAIPDRETAPKSGPDFGWNDTFVYTSDDAGVTWQQSPDVLRIELPTPNVTRYGAIEPNLLALRDGRTWMLLRDRGGRLWESFSATGQRWSSPARTAFISSDSPAELLRLRDGRIVLFFNACQNHAQPRSYAMGGRDVLHAAVSADEGRTWRGFREVHHETDFILRGDRGTAYASAVETREGKILLATGQGDLNRALILLDPAWLEETEQRDDLRSGPVLWTRYGAGLLRGSAADDAVELLPKPDALSGAAWNFPLAATGELSLRLRIPAGTTDLQLCLNDHFNRLDDTAAAHHSVFRLPLNLAPGEHRLHLRWTDATQRQGSVTATIGDTVTTHRRHRPAQFGVNYLRLEFRSADPTAGLLVSDLQTHSPGR